MIFTYKYIKHDIEKLQEFLNFLFDDVWLFAEGTFNFSKLEKNDELNKICEKLELEDTKWGNFFNDGIARIYDEFAKINDDNFKLELIDYYHNNNNIESLCSDKTAQPIVYSELKAKYPDLEKVTNSFYSKLYGAESPFNLVAFGQLNQKLLPSHYKEFIDSNNDGICPFCGIYPIDGNIVSTKDAYDHFLPKSIYPFNSINFKNLSPMCYKCNSGNKSTNDPIEHINGRTLAFYPYSNNHPEIELEFNLLSTNVNAITPADYMLSINAPTNIEELETWKRVFKIEERYDELICNKYKAKEWYEDIYDYYENAKSISEIEDAEKYYKKVIKATTHNPKSVENTIKRKFLEECKNKGLFSAYD